MDFDFSIGLDIEEIKRFENKTPENAPDFLDRIFTQKELEYCFKHKKYAQHLCARFCAKEAVIKALSSLGINDVYLKDIEILNSINGAPYVLTAKHKNIKIKLSMSHCRTYASASAAAFTEK